jgi:acyl-CoA reductase-like NAD-dependent aldehyde dehydrogenase
VATIVRPEVATYQQYIDGEWTGSAGGDTFEVQNPSTEEVVGLAPAGTREDARRAIEAARRSFDSGDWRNKTQLQRSRIMFEIAEHLAERSGDWAMLEAQTAGATIRKAAVVDVPLAVETFRSMAEQALQIPWYEPLPWIDIPHVSWNFVQREAIGVCTGIIPFNFPLMIAMWKLAPALAMGNSVVLKPSPFTPLTLLEVARAIDETGLLPRGVFNVVTGPGNELGEELVVNEHVDKVAFTGSTAVGRRILEMAAPTIKKVTLELGGKSANVVFADADLEAAAAAAPMAVFANAGQDCCARSRILVQDTVLERFLELLEPHVRAIRVGDPLDESTEMGPLISAAQRDTVASYVADDASSVAFRGSAPDGPGFWFAPTVLAPMQPQARAVREEIFGPVAAVIAFRDEADAVRLANDTIYGLSGSIWTRDGARALRMARGIEAGVLSINSNTSVRVATPFGGFKQSGYGRELGPHALDAYTEVKSIYYATGTAG